MAKARRERGESHRVQERSTKSSSLFKTQCYASSSVCVCTSLGNTVSLLEQRDVFKREKHESKRYKKQEILNFSLLLRLELRSLIKFQAPRFRHKFSRIRILSLARFSLSLSLSLHVSVSKRDFTSLFRAHNSFRCCFTLN